MNETRFLSLALIFDGAPLRVSRRPRCSPLHRSPDASLFLPLEPVRCVYTHYARDIYSRAADAGNAWCIYIRDARTVVDEQRPVF